MADDLVDWASVMAVHTISTAFANGAGYEYTDGETPVPAVIDDVTGGDPVPEAFHLAIASALREAHEAGREESRTRVEAAQEVASYLVSILPLTPAAIEIMSKELARLQDENRALRRELAARRAVDGWLRADSCRSLRVTYWGDVCATIWEDGNERIVAMEADYPALAAALGLEVEDE